MRIKKAMNSLLCRFNSHRFFAASVYTREDGGQKIAYRQCQHCGVEQFSSPERKWAPRPESKLMDAFEFAVFMKIDFLRTGFAIQDSAWVPGLEDGPWLIIVLTHLKAMGLEQNIRINTFSGPIGWVTLALEK